MLNKHYNINGLLDVLLQYIKFLLLNCLFNNLYYHLFNILLIYMLEVHLWINYWTNLYLVFHYLILQVRLRFNFEISHHKEHNLILYRCKTIRQHLIPNCNKLKKKNIKTSKLYKMKVVKSTKSINILSILSALKLISNDLGFIYF